MGIQRSFVPIGCVVVAAAAQTMVASAAVARQADASAALAAVREQFKAPGLAGAVMKDGKLVAIGVSGVRAQGKDTPATLADRWPIGSCSKPMARLVVARLAERGVWGFDDTLEKVLPGVAMGTDYKGATLAQVLAHRGGIQPYTEIGPGITPLIFELKGPPMEQRAAFTAHVLSEEPAAKPGTKFVYSNAGFCIIASAAEAKTGVPWETLVKNEVFTPLGMESAVVGTDPDAANGVRGHGKTGTGYRVQPQARRPLAVMAPAGGVCLNITDFAKFAAAKADLDGGRAAAGLTEKTLKALPELRPADAGAAGMGGQTFFGGDGFYTAAFAVWPEQRVAIAVASNAGDSDEVCAAAVEALRAAFAAEAPVRAREGPGGGARYGFRVMAEDPDAPWVIEGVEPGSIAEKAGLKAGDVVTAINGTAVKEIEPGARAALVKSPRLRLTVEREGKRVDIEIAK